GCQPEKVNNSGGGKVLARVNNEELTLEALQPYILTGLTPRDSAKMVQRLIEQWASDQLLYMEAREALASEEQVVEEEVQRYKRSLINHRFEEKVVEENLDTTVTKEEIENYYNANQESFILKDNIAKVNYVKVPLNNPSIEKIKKLLRSAQDKDRETLKSLCLQNAENYFLNDSTWLLMEDLRKEIPGLSQEASLNFPVGKTLEYSENGYYYYLLIKDIRIKNALSPLNYERQAIRKFIINARKADVLKQFRQQLLDKAREDKKMLVF
ncbi:MAG: hypothetical protein QM534_18115, partial [Sediminibacterium sp.]|nr:hypothetical protein [Sediminibacterium sp.]